MIEWILYTNLTTKLNSEWDSIIRSSLGEEIHSDRKMGYVFAREALRLALESYKVKTLPSDLELVRFDSLRKFPQFTISLSHSKKAGAAAVGKKTEFHSVGIDIETEDRQVREDVVRRISNENDIHLAPLELWCLKEAAFKCLMNTGNFPRPVEFSSIEIHEGKWIRSELQGPWELHRKEGHVVAIASLLTAST